MRIPYPYTDWDQVHTVPYGRVLYDLDISPNGRFLSTSLGVSSGRQSLRLFEITDLMEEEGYQTKFALDLARKFASERDYASALMYASDHVNATRDVSLWASNFYTYLLAKNGRISQAEPILSQLTDLGKPEATRFVEWYTDTFDMRSAEEPQVAESF